MDPGLDPDLGCAEWLRRKILFLRRDPGGSLDVMDLLRELQDYEKVSHVDAVRKLRGLSSELCRGSAIFCTTALEKQRLDKIWEALRLEAYSAPIPILNPKTECADWLTANFLYLKKSYGEPDASRIIEWRQRLEDAEAEEVRKKRLQEEIIQRFWAAMWDIRIMIIEMCRNPETTDPFTNEVRKLNYYVNNFANLEYFLLRYEPDADWRCYREMAKRIPGHPGPGRVYTQTFGTEYFRGTAREFGRKSPAPNQGNGAPPQTSGGLPPPVQDLDKLDIPTLERILNGLQRP